MAVNGDAFADELNAFNRVMNRGHRLGHWLTGEYGSSAARSPAAISRQRPAWADYIASERVKTCTAIAQDVAQEVISMIEVERQKPLPQ
ncbi:MAG TPA: hypothetical protein VFR86_13865 [Burkholderiaceae bacterium]|nr:hypothetical protein [Burkholderiaceae bacterium]